MEHIDVYQLLAKDQPFKHPLEWQKRLEQLATVDDNQWNSTLTYKGAILFKLWHIASKTMMMDENRDAEIYFGYDPVKDIFLSGWELVDNKCQLCKIEFEFSRKGRKEVFTHITELKRTEGAFTTLCDKKRDITVPLDHPFAVEMIFWNN